MTEADCRVCTVMSSAFIWLQDFKVPVKDTKREFLHMLKPTAYSADQGMRVPWGERSKRKFLNGENLMLQ